MVIQKTKERLKSLYLILKNWVSEGVCLWHLSYYRKSELLKNEPGMHGVCNKYYPEVRGHNSYYVGIAELI